MIADATPAFSEEQITRTVRRIGYLNDALVVKLGLKHLDQILKKMDLSEREDLKAALVTTMSANAMVFNTIGFDIRKSAGEYLGKAKLVDRAESDVVTLLRSTEVEPAQLATVAYAQTAKTSPKLSIVDVLKELKMNTTLKDIALGSADKSIITYLVQVAQADAKPEALYGLDGLDAADIVAANYRARLDPPAAPTELTATLTTYKSVQLSWKDNSQNEDGFIIERGEGEATPTEYKRVPSNQIYFADRDLSPLTSYRYRVNAYHWSKDTVAATNTVSISTPELPNPLPDPIPTPPDLPTSPTPGATFESLTKQLKIEIEQKLHPATMEALILVLKTGPTPVEVALAAGNLLEAQLTAALFNADGLSTSLTLQVIDALRYRSGYELVNMNYIESIRRDHSKKIGANKSALEARLLGDLQSASSR